MNNIYDIENFAGNSEQIEKVKSVQMKSNVCACKPTGKRRGKGSGCSCLKNGIMCSKFCHKNKFIAVI